MKTNWNRSMQMILIGTGAVGGMVALGVTAATVWNCKALRMKRAVKKTGKILYQVGAAMQTVSQMAP